MKTLKFWILLLISITMIGILITGLSSAYYTTKNNLIEDSLQTNRVFSQQLAENTNKLFDDMQTDLRLAANDIVFLLKSQKSIQGRLNKVMSQKDHFNSMSVIDPNGTVLTTYPDVGITGQKLNSIGVIEAITNKTETISEPYLASTGRLILLITSPLWNEQGEYLGFVAGTIYLQEENTLQDVLGTHFANDGSYVWVVDKKGNILYHPEQNRIGDTVLNNEVTQHVLDKESGAQQVTNSKGKEFLAGFTYVKKSGWGIISQTPFDVVVNPVGEIVRKMFFMSVPFFLIILFLSLVLANKIAAPLQKLALYSQQLREDHPSETPNIPTWYFEAKQLNETIQAYSLEQRKKLESYKETSYTDVLTGLKNRRYMEKITKRLIEEKNPFSAVLIDIDFFKRVNDTYGHNKGDEVLQFLSSELNEVSHDRGVPLRLGGEEFLILLPNHDLSQAMSLTEALRIRIEKSITPTGEGITISAGVGAYSTGENYSDFLHRVDLALYAAKQNGRNRVEKSQTTETTSRK